MGLSVFQYICGAPIGLSGSQSIWEPLVGVWGPSRSERLTVGLRGPAGMRGPSRAERLLVGLNCSQ